MSYLCHTRVILVISYYNFSRNCWFHHAESLPMSVFMLPRYQCIIYVFWGTNKYQGIINRPKIWCVYIIVYIYIYISCGGRRLKKESKSRRRNCLLLFFIILKVVFSFMDIVFLGLDPTERAQTNRLLVKDEFIYNSLYCLYRQPLFLSQASNLDIKQFS